MAANSGCKKPRLARGFFVLGDSPILNSLHMTQSGFAGRLHVCEFVLLCKDSRIPRSPGCQLFRHLDCPRGAPREEKNRSLR